MTGCLERIRYPSHSLRRIFWLFMLLLHTPPLWGTWRAVWNSGGALESCLTAIALTITTLFFVLKVIDVRFLHLPLNRRAIIAFCMIVALMHVDLARSGDRPMLVCEYTTLLATTTWLLSICPRVRRWLDNDRDRVASRARHLPSLHPSDHIVWLDGFRPRCWISAFHLYTLRAPPV